MNGNIKFNVIYYQPLQNGKLHIGCLNCSTASYKLDMNRILDVGFGHVIASKDGEPVYECMGMDRYRIKNADGKWVEIGDSWTTAWTIERMANQNPFHYWEIEFFGPLHGETYQRQGYMHWPCIKSNPGFA